ncbi:MAG TPA: hypothetical protein VNK92_07760, partial [Vicinamibacterales bacterium]|nr:hypothetical protein [Vicinamibacterales bacterium]
GLRWERVENYLPEQSSPPSRWFPDLQRSFPAVRDIINWKTLGPRVSAVYDLFGTGRTALKFSAGRYYYMISTGTVNAVNPNFSVSAQYAWNDRNGDLRFQEGEQVGTPIVSGGLTTSFDPGFDRPFTDELTAGVDHELLPNVRLSAVFTWRAEKDLQATRNDAAPLDTWVRVTRPDPGPDGLAGTADDGTVRYFDRTLPGTLNVITNDPTARQLYKGLEVTLTKRFADRWQLLAGYTLSKATFERPSVATSPNAFINAEGPIVNDRPHQLKVSGTYLLPYDVYLGANLRIQSGPPINRTVNVPLSFGGGTATIAVEPPGTHRLDPLRTLDLRAAKTFRLPAGRELELDLDVFNVTNANTAWEARSLTGRLRVRRGGDPNAPLLEHPQFLSPSQILGPRIVRFGVGWRW